MLSNRPNVDIWRWTVLIGLAMCSVFVVWPLFELARQSFIGQSSQTFGLENYTTFFSSNYFMRAAYNSLWIASGTTAMTLLMGIPLAYMFSRFEFPGNRS